MSEDANGTTPAAVTPAKQDRSVVEGAFSPIGPDEDLPVKDVWNIGDEVWVRRTVGGATPSAASSTQSYQYYSGIVCYLGSVLFAAGDDWVGIRLTGDSAGKGKNDGAVQGMRYFAAPPNSGLFVRMSSLRVRSSKATPMSSSSTSTTTTPVRTTMERATTPLSSNRMDRTPALETMLDTTEEEIMPSSTMVPSNQMERTPAPKNTADIATEEAKPAASAKAPPPSNGNNKKRMVQQDSKDPHFPDILSPDDGSTKKSAPKGAKKVAATKSAPAATESSDLKGPPKAETTVDGSAKQAPRATAVKATAGVVAAAAATSTKSTKSSGKSAPKYSTATTTAAPPVAAKSTASSKAAPVKTTSDSIRKKAATAKNGKTVSSQDPQPDEFRLHTAITPIPPDENEDNEWRFQRAEEGLFSPERRQTSASTPQRRHNGAPIDDGDNDDDKFDWSLSQQRWIRFLSGLSIFGIWILTGFVLFCGLEGFDGDGSNDIPSNSTNSTAAIWAGDGIHVHPHIHHVETPSPHAWLPASLLLLLSFLAGMLRLPLCQTPRHGSVTPLAVYSSRLAATVMALTSLVVVAYIAVFTIVVGEDDSLANTHIIGKMSRWMLWLLVDVLIILIPSCVALMLGFYPGYDSSDTAESHGEGGNPTVQQSFQSEIVPLLNQSNGNLVDDEEAGIYQLMGDGENGVEDIEGSLTATSRVRGSRRLLQMAASQVMYLYLGCAVLLLRLPFSLAIPHFVSTTLTALAQGHYAAAHREILTLAICGSIDAFLDFWCIFLFGYANLRIVKRVRLDLFHQLLRMECAFFDAHHSGTLTSRLNSDCSAVASDLTWFFRFSIESVVRITGIAVYMLIRSPQLAGCALAIVPAVAIVNKIYGDWLARNAAAVQDALASTQTVAQEALTHIRTVISLGAENQIFHAYRDRVLKHYELNVRQTFWQGVYYMFVSTFLINTIVQAFLLWYGAYLISQDRLTAGVLLAFMLYQGQLQNETMNLFQSYSSLIKSSGAGDQVFSLLDRRTLPPGLGYGVEPEEDEQGEVEASSVAVEFEKVTFRYPSRPEHKVLDGFDLKVPAGTTVALVGPSGEFRQGCCWIFQTLARCSFRLCC